MAASFTVDDLVLSGDCSNLRSRFLSWLQLLNNKGATMLNKLRESKLKTGIAIFVGLIIAIALASGTEDTTINQADTNQEATVATTEQAEVEPARFEIVEKSDTSYAGCKRVSYKVKVDPSSSSLSIVIMEKNLTDSNKSEWDDITIFTYSNENTDEVIKKSAYDIDTTEYSTCE